MSLAKTKEDSNHKEAAFITSFCRHCHFHDKNKYSRSIPNPPFSHQHEAHRRRGSFIAVRARLFFVIEAIYILQSLMNNYVLFVWLFCLIFYWFKSLIQVTSTLAIVGCDRPHTKWIILSYAILGTWN